MFTVLRYIIISVLLAVHQWRWLHMHLVWFSLNTVTTFYVPIPYLRVCSTKNLVIFIRILPQQSWFRILKIEASLFELFVHMFVEPTWNTEAQQTNPVRIWVSVRLWTLWLRHELCWLWMEIGRSKVNALGGMLLHMLT